MSEITSEVAEKALKLDAANLLKKVRDGKKPLTRAERLKLEAIAAGDKTPEVKPWASTLPELAKALTTTRPTLDKWRKMKGAPKPKANGLHDVRAWQAFMAKNDLAGSIVDASDPDLIALRARKLLAETREKEFKLAVLEGRYADLEDVHRQWQSTANQGVMLLRKKFEDELPPICSGLDALGIRQQNKAAIDEVLKILRGDK